MTLSSLAAATAVLPAATASPAATPATVSELLVPGGPPPKVVASFPAPGSQVAAGVLVIKLVFDQPMAPDGWSYGPTRGGDFPACLARPRLLPDRRAFALLCSVGPHKSYAIAVNPVPAFVGASGRLAMPATLSFSTTEQTVVGLHAALEQAGLTDADEPIMTWKDEATGVSRSAPPAR